ncbi:hypothetical protein VM1G_11893 [Cytospora mali]|uniref:Uncharacterized protein n=1 Tax=Cytospora mali TaxID=578113 RepID=A0A194W9Z1_CYTMA|nr:hypothetical protein VM1G_11893 [Valsa mali]
MPVLGKVRKPIESVLIPHVDPLDRMRGVLAMAAEKVGDLLSLDTKRQLRTSHSLLDNLTEWNT